MALMTGGVASCSPGPKSILAVETVDGSTAQLLTMTCSEFTADHFGVYQDDGPDDDLRKWAVSRSFTGPRVDSVQVFKQPDGWKTYSSKLTGFEKGSTYVASVDGGIDGRAVSGELSFGADQLRGLVAGDVLASDGDGNTVTMGRDDFLKAADERCRELAR
ncbi:hypothetical protein ACFW2Y_04755 [Streptomyces sp. NPDC058877]|uniref:hypothetical protein n=1 Tax=Streptomyces sp. NPDC058877 TaxID=3346665 RepID=UPI003693222A